MHQFNLSVEREIGFDMAVEARYVGTLGRGIWRGVDYNQVSSEGPFLEDFLRARQNGFLALAAGQGFNPAFNAGPRRQPAADLHHPVRRRLADQRHGPQQHPDRPGRRARRLLPDVGGDGGAGASRLLRQRGIYAADNIINGASTDYHALQIETRRRFKNGIFWQANYTFSKTLTDSTGTAQARFEPFLDNARPGIERMRSEFHVTHVLNANAIWELPFGEGQPLARSGRRAERARRRLAALEHRCTGRAASRSRSWRRAAPSTATGRSADNMAVTDGHARRDRRRSSASSSSRTGGSTSSTRR